MVEVEEVGEDVLVGVPVLPVLGLAGYVMAFLNSLWIIYGMWRSGRE